MTEVGDICHEITIETTTLYEASQARLQTCHGAFVCPRKEEYRDRLRQRLRQSGMGAVAEPAVLFFTLAKCLRSWRAREFAIFDPGGLSPPLTAHKTHNSPIAPLLLARPSHVICTTLHYWPGRLQPVESDSPTSQHDPPRN